MLCGSLCKGLKTLRFVACLLLAIVLVGCATNNMRIKGKLTEYYTVDEYSQPVALVIDKRGNQHLIVLMCYAVTKDGVYDEELWDKMRNRTLYDVEIDITDGEKGEKISLNGKKSDVYLAYQINVIDKIKY